MRAALIALVALLISATAVRAQLSPPDAERARKVAVLIDWVKEAGRDGFLPKMVAEPLGFGGSELPDKLPARWKGYNWRAAPEIGYFFYVVPVNGSDKYVLAYKYPGQNEVWNVAPSGAILDHLVYNADNKEGAHFKDPNLKLFDKVLSFGYEPH